MQKMQFRCTFPDFPDFLFFGMDTSSMPSVSAAAERLRGNDDELDHEVVGEQL